MLSNTCKYAIRAIVYISVKEADSGKVGLKEISTELDIPHPFLGKILQSLAKKNLLKSSKGPNGGFSLGKKAEEISLIEIIEVIDGTSAFDTCLVRTSKCSDDNPCGIHDNITKIRKDYQDFFKNRTIEDLATEFVNDSSGRVKI